MNGWYDMNKQGRSFKKTNPYASTYDPGVVYRDHCIVYHDYDEVSNLDMILKIPNETDPNACITSRINNLIKLSKQPKVDD